MFERFRLSAVSYFAGKAPHFSFAALLAGLAAISQDQSDYATLFGHLWGPKVYVLAKWFADFCIGVGAYGHVAGMARQITESKDTPNEPR